MKEADIKSSSFSLLVVFLVFGFLPLVPSLDFLQVSDVWVKWAVLEWTGIGGLFVILFKSPWGAPSLHSSQKLIFYLLLLALFGNYFLHDRPFITQVTLERILFFVFVLFFFSFFRAETNFRSLLPAIYLSTFLIVIDGLSFNRELSSSFLGSSTFFSTFGNPNLTAQFLGFSLIFQLYGLKFVQNKYAKWGALFLFLISLHYFLHLNCRSTILGFSAIFIFLMVTGRLHSRKFLLALVLGSFAFSYLVDVIYSIKLPHEVILQKSFLYRWTLIKDALVMALEKPFGWGIGGFEFNSVPYHKGFGTALYEGQIDRSPHCEPLRFLVEDGWVVSGLLVALFLSLFWKARGKIKNTFDDITNQCFWALLLFLGVEFLFQFPMEMSFPFALFSALCGYFLAAFYPGPLISASNMSATSITLKLFCLSVLICFVFTMISSRIYSLSFRKDYEKNLMALKWDPLNWEAALNLTDIDFYYKNAPLAEQRAHEALAHNPHNYLFKRILIHVYDALGKRKESCALAAEYDALFEAKSSQHEFLKQRCGARF